MTAPKLKPCPFCGGDAGAYPDPNHSTGWDVGCFSGTCDVEPHVWAVHRATAEMQWNTRATQPDPRDAVIAKLVKALEVYAGPCGDGYEDEPCGYTGNLCCRTARAAITAAKAVME